MGPKKSIHNANEKQGSRIHSVCIFPVKYTFWPAERRSWRNSVLLKITDDLLLWAPICLPGTICDTLVKLRALKTCSLPRRIKRVCPWTDENVPLVSFLCALNGNVDKYFLPWSTCFAATVHATQQHKRANYEEDEPGWGAGWGATYFTGFLSIVWRYYFRDVNICAAFGCICVCVCVSLECVYSTWKKYSSREERSP